MRKDWIQRARLRLPADPMESDAFFILACCVALILGVIAAVTM